MSRTSRVYVQGLPQLIQLNGHNNDIVFHDDEDYLTFLNCLRKAGETFDFALHAWTLLPNQLMMLLTPGTKEDLSRLVQHIGRRYVPWFNQKYHRSGSLWEGRYNSSLIEPEAYLLIAQKFVDTRLGERQAVRGERPAWSSYWNNIGERQQQMITPHEQYLRLGNTPQERAIQYARFIQSPLSPSIEKRLQDCLNQNRLLGTPQYCQRLERQLHRPVQPRQAGRPRKYFHNQVTDWAWLENQAACLLSRYCYQEVRLPLLESEGTNAAFTATNEPFPLAGSHSALLRGEGTMGCLQMINQHPHLQSTSKLWYQGVMFRSTENTGEHIEQYQQLGVEAFGFAGVDIELEQLVLQYDFFKSLGLQENVELKINSTGTQQEFAAFRAALRAFYQPFTSIFEPEWAECLAMQPENLLRSDNPLLAKLRSIAPAVGDFLGEESRRRFDCLLESLTKIHVPFEVDRWLYPSNAYCQTHFEWHCEKLMEHSLLCRGGRYDDCASTVLETPIQACGFALMLDPIMRLLRLTDKHLLKQQVTDVVIIPGSPAASTEALSIGRSLRKTFPQMSIANDFSHMRVNACVRNARRLGGRFIIVVPPDGAATEVALYDRDSGEEQTVNIAKAISILSRSLNALPVC
nr:ATP phosphoribosyltransferase regulatory subunit [uncultured Erwinia sp.]